jgi:hypothetical protein
LTLYKNLRDFALKPILQKFFGRASDLADTEPILGLFLGAALLAVFLAAFALDRPATEHSGKSGLLWLLYANFTRLLWAALLVAFLVGTVAVLRTYLRQSVANFQRTHGRVTTANYNAVQTIWGAEQQQGELRVEIYNDEEVTERIESEDLTKPAVLRKKTVRRFATGNPFLAARHDVTLRQNPRKKGSALYGGYETDCRFTWRLKNPAAGTNKCHLIFPLPAAGAMYDELSAALNGQDVLPQVQIREGALILARDAQPGEAMDFQLAFKSRGMSHWYFQVREAREVRDFTLTLTLPDLPKDRLNYPEGCMTPTGIQPAAGGAGSVLTYRLDHALSNKGMGVALPQLPQPGAMTNAVLGEIERAWVLLFAMLGLSLTLAAVRHAVLLTALFGAATAFAYGLLGGFSDLLFGFWGTGGLVLVPGFALLVWLLIRAVRGSVGRWLGLQMILIGIIYPCIAGLDAERQSLYLNLCAVVFLAFAASLLMKQPAQQAPLVEKPLAVG